MTARNRALSRFTSRLERTGQREQFRQAIEQPSLYAGEGEIRPLGAAGGIPPRSNQSTGSLAVGQPVAASQGLIQAIPNAVQAPELQETAAQIKALLAMVRSQLGLKVIDNTNPNDGTVFTRHPYDRTYDKTLGVEYWWEPSTASVEGEWMPMRQIRVSDSDPTGDGAHDGAIWLKVPESGNPSIYIWREFSSEWLEISGGAPVRVESYSPTTETGSVGETWINTTVDRSWAYSGDAWISNGAKVWSSPPASSDDLAGGDILYYEAGGVYLAIWDSENGQWLTLGYCAGPNCEAQQPEPPPSAGCDPITSDNGEFYGWNCG